MDSKHHKDLVQLKNWIKDCSKKELKKHIKNMLSDQNIKIGDSMVLMEHNGTDSEDFIFKVHSFDKENDNVIYLSEGVEISNSFAWCRKIS